jgi:hypothetical protein
MRDRRGRSHNPKLNRLRDARLDRVSRVASLYIQGHTQRQMSELMNVSFERIRRDIKLAKEIWSEQASEDLKKLLSKEIARLDEIEGQAWYAWRRSQRAQRERTTERGMDDEGVPSKTRKVCLKVRQAVGDSDYLKIALSCVVQRSRLLGLDTRNEGDPDDIQVTAIKVIVNNREEAKAMMEFQEFRCITQN